MDNKCEDFKTASMNSDANCHRKRQSYSRKLLRKNPDVCFECVYNKNESIASAPSLLKENQELKRWKESAMMVLRSWDNVDDYISSHSEVKLGSSKSEATLVLLKERDELKVVNAQLRHSVIQTTTECNELKAKIKEHIKVRGNLVEEIGGLKKHSFNDVCELGEVTRERDELKKQIGYFKQALDTEQALKQQLQQRHEDVRNVVRTQKKEKDELKVLNTELVQALKAIIQTGYYSTSEGNVAIELLKKLNAI